MAIVAVWMKRLVRSSTMATMLRIANIIVALLAVIAAPALASSTTTKLSANSRLEFFALNAGHQPGDSLVSSETLLSSSDPLRLTTSVCSVAPNNVRTYPDGSVRTPDGKFAGKTGTIPGTPAVLDAQRIVDSRAGWQVVGREISVRDASGTLRRYDLVAKNPAGEFVGIEVKGGGATLTAQQRAVDASLNARGGFDTVGQRAIDAGIDRISRTEVIHVP
jgi:hypothetical protein